MSAASVAGTFQVYEVPVNPLAITLTVFKAVEGPSLRVRVTGPEAPDQLMLKADPAVTPLKDGFVNLTAWATAKAAAAAKRAVNCILEELKVAVGELQ